MGAREQFGLTTDADVLIGDIWREYLAPPPRYTVTEWAEARRVLSSKDSAEPGPYRVLRTPYAREPQDCLSAHSSVEEVVLIWGAQTSKTTIMLNWTGYTIDVNPGPMMMLQPTIDLGKRFSRQRVAPMVEESPVLRAKVKANRSRDEANTMLLKEFMGGFLAIAGANSAAGLRSMPVRDLGEDEIDNYPQDVDGEGDPCGLAEARQTTFARRKRLKTSTPTEKDISRIEKSYLATDQCRYHVPCPHCQVPQALEWGATKEWGIRFKRDEAGEVIPSTVHYLCAHCREPIAEHHKTAMLAAGEWVAERPGVAGGRRRGFHLSSLYSPLGWFSWAEMAAEWCKAMAAARLGDTSALRVFVNTRLAETFEDAGERADSHALQKRAEDYALRTVPWRGLVIVGATDVQDDRLECYAWAYGRGEESWLVDRQVFYGDPALPEGREGSPWNDVTAWRRDPFRHAGGAKMRMSAHAVDSGGHHTQAVYTYARRHMSEKVLAIKGESQRARPIIGKPVEVETTFQGKKMRRGVKRWPVGTDTAKTQLYGRMRQDKVGPGYMHFSKYLPPEVYEQITSERYITKYLRGRARREWVKPQGKRNEALDCAVYALAAAHFLGLPRYTADQWKKLETALTKAAIAIALAEGKAKQTEQATAEVLAKAVKRPEKPIEPAEVVPPSEEKGTLAPEMRVTDETAAPPPPAPTPAPSSKPQPAKPRTAVRRGGWGRKKW